MNRLYKKCLIVTSVVGIPTIFGPAGIVLSVLIMRAGLSMFHDNILMQLLVVVGMVLTFVVPILFFTTILYWICKAFMNLVTPAPKKVVVNNSKGLVVRNTATPYIPGQIVDAEWTDVN